jgi:flagellar protein FliL
MAEPEETPVEDEEIQPPKSNKLMLIVIVLNVVVMAAGGAAFFMGGGGDDGKAEAAETKTEDDMMMEMEGPPSLVKLEPFIVNLNDAGGSRYLKLSCEVEVPGEKGVEVVTGRMAPMRHRVITYLSELSYGDIAGKGKKVEVQKALVMEINDELKGKVVKNLYFTEFVIQ